MLSASQGQKMLAHMAAKQRARGVEGALDKVFRCEKKGTGKEEQATCETGTRAHEEEDWTEGRPLVQHWANVDLQEQA